MASGKSMVKEQLSELPRLNQMVGSLERAETPAKLLRLLVKAAGAVTGLPVSAFSYNPAGTPDLTDASALPADQRAGLSYPPAPAADHLQAAAAKWQDSAQVKQLQKHLQAAAVQLHWLRAG